MLFIRELAIKIITGQKTQTRRVAKLDEVYLATEQAVYTNNVEKLKWQVEREYAVQTKRGGVALSKFRLKDIRFERAEQITEQDAIAEGFSNRDEFLATWVKINGKGSVNDRVWVLDFEPVFVVGQQVKLVKCEYADMQHIELPAIGTLSLNHSQDALFWLEIPFAGIGSRKFCVPISWLSPIAPESAE